MTNFTEVAETEPVEPTEPVIMEENSSDYEKTTFYDYSRFEEMPIAAVQLNRKSLYDADCDAESDQSSCDGISKCTWCKSAAVGERCYLMTEAEALPASIFSCDNLPSKQIEEPKQKESKTLKYIKAMQGDAECSDEKKDSDCDGVSGCSWCQSAAVPSACYPIDQAAALPPSIFACDNLPSFTTSDSAD